MSQAGIVDVQGTNPQIPTDFVTNMGTAIPIANTLEILGTTVVAHSIPLRTIGSGNTVTIQAQYASASATSIATNAGFASFNSADFTVDANGFVTSTGSSGTESFIVDAATAPGTNPVVPNGSGDITITGGQVAAGTTVHVIQTNSLAANTYTIQVQRSQAVASSTIGDNGVSHFNSTYFTVDTNGFVSLVPSAVGSAFTVDAFTAPGTNPVVPNGSGNITITGGQVAAGTTTNVIRTDSLAANTYTIQIQRSQAVASSTVGDNGVAHFNSANFTVDANGFVSAISGTDLHVARYIVSAGGTANGANFTTIAAAYAAAVTAGAPQTVFIQPGTYTENITLTAGINIAAFDCDAQTPNVIISGNTTLSTAGTVSISGIRLQTNSAPLLTVSGSAASHVILKNCYLNCTNNTGISFTNSNAASSILVYECEGDIGTTGIALFANTSVGGLFFNYCQITNSGGSSTPSTSSSGNPGFLYSYIANAVTTSSTGSFGCMYTEFDVFAHNIPALILNGTGSTSLEFSKFDSGTASCISIGTGVIGNIYSCTFDSSNANAITGAGTINYGGLVLIGTALSINVTTQNPAPFDSQQGGTGLNNHGLTLNLVTGAASGKVLTSDASGNATWQAGGGGGGGITAIQGDTGSAATSSTVHLNGGIAALTSNGLVFDSNSTTVTLNYNYLNLPSTTNSGDGILYMDDVSTGRHTLLHIFSSGTPISGGSVFLGIDAGNLTMTSPSALNTGLGALSLTALTTGSENTCVGYTAGQLIDSGNNNCAMGAGSLAICSSGSNNLSLGTSSLGAVDIGTDNTSIGYSTGGALSSGSFNIIIGSEAGQLLTGTESSNIIIGNNGTAGDANILRLGTQGTGNGEINTTFIAGIAGSSVTGNVVLVDPATGQLGSAGATPAFYAYANATINNVTGGGVFYTVQFNSTLLNVATCFNTATGLFTAPVTGFYSFSTTIAVFNLGVVDFLVGYIGSAISQRLYQVSNTTNDGGTLILPSAWQMPMTAGDTVGVQLFAGGSTTTINLSGTTPTSAPFNSYSSFSGYLVH